MSSWGAEPAGCTLCGGVTEPASDASPLTFWFVPQLLWLRVHVLTHPIFPYLPLKYLLVELLLGLSPYWTTSRSPVFHQLLLSFPSLLPLSCHKFKKISQMTQKANVSSSLLLNVSDGESLGWGTGKKGGGVMLEGAGREGQAKGCNYKDEQTWKKEEM